MNAGLSNLATLKAHLLPATLTAQTTYDAAITALGKGVAALMEGYCNRRFYRTVGDTETFAGPRAHLYLARCPVETVSKVELRSDYDTGFEEQTDAIQNLNEAAGLVVLNAELGSDDADLIRVTYTGGYYWDTTEDDSGTQPTGSTALPDDLKLAWLTQCAEFWNKRDKLGVGLVQKPDQVTMLKDLDLLPAVKAMLQPYQRLAAL